MFSKKRYQSFVHYYHLDDAKRWADDFQELKAHGIDHVILSRGFDLKDILSTEERKQHLVQFLDLAHDQKIRCILNPGNPRELYLLPDARRWRLDYTRHVAETIGAHPAVYALLLEDNPTGGAQSSFDRWKPLTTELEGRLEAQSLTEDGYQRAVKFWQMEQYSKYIHELVVVVKKTQSRLKTAIGFNLESLFPQTALVNIQETARALDFILIEASPGWQGEPQEGRYLTRFVTNVTRGLVETDVWVVVGAHINGSRYQPCLRELREWTRQAIQQGADGIGWFGCDTTQWNDDYRMRGVPVTESSRERWNAMLTLSRAVTAQEPGEREVTPYACLLSSDSMLSLVSYTHLFVPNLILGERIGLPITYVSDNQVGTGNLPQKSRYLFTTPCPSERGEVVERLLRFMQAGGWVIASSDDFALDEQMRPADSRQRLFGIQEETSGVDEDRMTLAVDLKHLPSGASLPAAWNRARLTRLEEGTVVLGHWSDRTPAIVLIRRGKGGALYIGTDPYRAALFQRDQDDWILFLQSIAHPSELRGLIG